MAVGGIRGGGKGGPKGPKGAGGKAPAGGGSSFKVDKSESLVGASREASSSNVGGVGGAGAAGGASGVKGAGSVGATGGAGAAGKAAAASAADPVAAQAMEIARQLKSGQLKSKEEATKKFVAEILKEKLRMQSKALTSRIADSLQDDPRLNQALERLWAKG
ncbi:MAG: hypothetical protein ACJ790_01140 [Myxococcaceae bacterium]